MRGSEHTELRAFVAIAERRSFARAAAHLGVTASALSQTIRGLEERLGVRLLNRTTRSVALTEAGVRLLARIGPAFADLDAAVADVRTMSTRPSGLLRINSSRIAAVHYLAPLIGPFLEEYPDITLDLVVDDALVDIVGDRFDAGVRLGEKVERDMIAVKLSGEVRMAVVASPGYLARFGIPLTPHDLRHHRCINFRWPTGATYRWEFEQGGEDLEVLVEGPLIVNDSDVAIRAALDGTGIVYLFHEQVRALLGAGQLVPLLADWLPAFPGFYLYHPSRRQTLPALRAFLDFVRRGMRGEVITVR